MSEEKALRAGGLKRADMADMQFPHYFEILPEDVDYSDIFHPAFWRHHKNVKMHSLIRLRSASGAFDIDVTVVRILPSGVLVEFRGGRPPAGVNPYQAESEALKEALRQKPAPIDAEGKLVIRVDHTPKTKWRIIGLDHIEIKRGFENKSDAEAERQIYLAQLNMRDPTPDEIAAEMKRRAGAKEPVAA